MSHSWASHLISTITDRIQCFLCKPKHFIRVSLFLVMECESGSSCPSASLMVPSLDSCLPMPLDSFTWLLNIPEDSSLDLVSPTGSLKQSLPGQECNQSVLLRVAEADGFSVGDFCSDGVIQKVQVHANVSVTAKAQDFSKTREPLLNVSVSPEIGGKTIQSL